MQLDDSLTSIRWSWHDYLLIDEIVDIRPSTDKPLHFVLMYSQVSAPADRTLTLVCKTLKHAQQWVRSLRVTPGVREGMGLTAGGAHAAQVAFKVASNGRETLSIAQQQIFFACLNRNLTKEEPIIAGGFLVRRPTAVMRRRRPWRSRARWRDGGQ